MVEKKEKFPSEWVTIECSKCKKQKKASGDRHKKLIESGKWGDKLQKYLCRECRKA